MLSSMTLLLIPWQLCFDLVSVYIREYPRGFECKTRHATRVQQRLKGATSLGLTRAIRPLK